MSAERPQLHMRRWLADLPDLELPEGYALCTFTPGDAAAFVELLRRNGELGEWSLERAARLFGPDGEAVLEASYFALRDGEPVATAQLDRNRDRVYAPFAELGWVAALPEHRGRGVGRAVCLAVMHAAARAGHPEIFLRTDDHRLPAIKSYLGLGFEPWHVDPTAAARWRVILAQLA